MKERVTYFDGVRGLMALNVVLHHFTILFFPELYYVNQNCWWSKSPLAVLNNGNIAVQYFFVLSSFLLTCSMYTRHIDFEAVIKKVVSRYFRLIPMVFLATVLAYGLMKGGMMYHHMLKDYISNFDAISCFNNFTPSLGNLFTNIFLNTFINTNEYVSPFWTIKWEMIGYFVTLALLSLKEKKKIHIFVSVLVLGILYVFAQNVVPFVLGMLLAECMLERKDFFMKKISSQKMKWIVSTLSVFLMTVPQNYAGIHFWMKYFPGSPTIWRAIGICGGLIIVIFDAKIQKIFNAKLLQFLGRNSFGIYAVHWPIMLSVGCFCFVNLYSVLGYKLAALIELIPVLLITVCLAAVFTQMSDKVLKTTKVLFR